MRAVQCDSCGGAVAFRPGHQEPTCLFCGSEALAPLQEGTGVEQPTRAIPFDIDTAAADEAFRSFARGSIWYPSAIRTASLELERLMLPAWAWSGESEAHWAGLVRAQTESGKAPRTGSETRYFEQVLVPASSGLKQEELRGVAPYDEGALEDWDPDVSDIPYEIAQMTQEAARGRGADEMKSQHREHLVAAHQLLSCNVSGVVSSLTGRTMCVPVWIGVYRHREVPYRVVINGQTGQLFGRAPISWWKVAGAVVAVAALLGLLVYVAGSL